MTGNQLAAAALVGLLSAHQHPWAVQLGMQWLELVLRLLPAGTDLLSRLHAWDALQVHQFRWASADVQAKRQREVCHVAELLEVPNTLSVVPNALPKRKA